MKQIIKVCEMLESIDEESLKGALLLLDEYGGSSAYINANKKEQKNIKNSILKNIEKWEDYNISLTPSELKYELD